MKKTWLKLFHGYTDADIESARQKLAGPFASGHIIEVTRNELKAIHREGIFISGLECGQAVGLREVR